MTTVTNSDVPAPCPFCGDQPVIRRTMQEYPADEQFPAGEYEAHVAIECDTCGISMGEEYRDDAMAAWNRRSAVQLPTFQQRVEPWMDACFGPEISADRLERNDRFIEEALELIQASGYPKERAYALIDYVYGRDQGEIHQEVGGVMVTLAAHCLAHGIDMHQSAEAELARIWTKVDAIRAKQAAKPTGSALPIGSIDQAYP